MPFRREPTCEGRIDICSAFDTFCQQISKAHLFLPLLMESDVVLEGVLAQYGAVLLSASKARVASDIGTFMGASALLTASFVFSKMSELIVKSVGVYGLCWLRRRVTSMKPEKSGVDWAELSPSPMSSAPCRSATFPQIACLLAHPVARRSARNCGMCASRRQGS